MARTKQRKVGDRIFYEKYDGSIGTCLIKRIEPVEDKIFDKHGNRLTGGRVFKYNYYHTGRNTMIEDYNCLSDNDPRVNEFCKGKKFITSSFKDDLMQWLEAHCCHKGDTDVTEILNEIVEYFE